MENHSHRGRDSHRQTDQIRSSDDHSVDKIVDAVGEQIHIAHRMDGMVGFQGVLMPPEEKLLKNKEQEYAGQDPERGFNFCRQFLE